MNVYACRWTFGEERQVTGKNDYRILFSTKACFTRLISLGYLIHHKLFQSSRRQRNLSGKKTYICNLKEKHWHSFAKHALLTVYLNLIQGFPKDSKIHAPIVLADILADNIGFTIFVSEKKRTEQ